MVLKSAFEIDDRTAGLYPPFALIMFPEEAFEETAFFFGGRRVLVCIGNRDLHRAFFAGLIRFLKDLLFFNN